MGVFESTIVSVGYSLLVVLFWLGSNVLVATLTKGAYAFPSEFIALSRATDLSGILSPYTLAFAVIYFACFAAIGFLVYDFQYMDIWFQFLHRTGATRFSQHLTPWEDFLSINRWNWIAVELKDGRTLVGKVGLFSQLPFKKQLVLDSGSDAPISLYGPDLRKIDFGPDISQTYIPFDEIRAMHAIEDKTIKVVHPTAWNYALTFLTLFLGAGATLYASIASAASITFVWPNATALSFSLFGVAIISLVLNFVSLRNH